MGCKYGPCGQKGGCLHQDEKAKLGYQQESSSGVEKYRNKQPQCALQLAIQVAGESLGVGWEKARLLHI